VSSSGGLRIIAAACGDHLVGLLIWALLRRGEGMLPA
jgi:hypothetical protein